MGVGAPVHTLAGDRQRATQALESADRLLARLLGRVAEAQLSQGSQAINGEQPHHDINEAALRSPTSYDDSMLRIFFTTATARSSEFCPRHMHTTHRPCELAELTANGGLGMA